MILPTEGNQTNGYKFKIQGQTMGAKADSRMGKSPEQ